VLWPTRWRRPGSTLRDEALDALPQWWARDRASTRIDPDAVPGRRRDGSGRTTAAPTRSACWSPTSTGGGKTDVHREMRVVRLGQGVDRTGELAPEAIERTGRRWWTTPPPAAARRRAVRMVATSASRDARNRDDFRGMVLEVLGVEPEVITRRRGGGAVLRRRDRGTRPRRRGRSW
jgi:hypothetical protein